MMIYAIGDIHGQLGKLKAAHDLIAADAAREGVAAPEVVHLGDLVDRGPDSRGVLDFLIAGQASGAAWHVLLGNHDRMFRGFLDAVDHHDEGLRPDLSWLHPRLGGVETLVSYGLHAPGDRPLAPVWAEAQKAVPPEHRAFLAARPTSLQRGDCLFVHAGLQPGLPLAAQSETTLVWMREPFLSDRREHGAFVVHGHTVVDHPTHYGNRLNIDSGAAYGGPLSAVAIEPGRQVFHLTPQGRRPLTPGF